MDVTTGSTGGYSHSTPIGVGTFFLPTYITTRIVYNKGLNKSPIEMSSVILFQRSFLFDVSIDSKG